MLGLLASGGGGDKATNPSVSQVCLRQSQGFWLREPRASRSRARLPQGPATFAVCAAPELLWAGPTSGDRSAFRAISRTQTLTYGWAIAVIIAVGANLMR